MSRPAPLALKDIRRAFDDLVILDGASLTVEAGEMVALLGPSGSGKSSLLHIAGLLEKPTAGEVVVNGVTTGRIKDKERTALRREAIGFVYQFHHLLPEFSALDNVEFPMRIAGQPRRAATERATDLLRTLGLGERMTHQPAQLSGGEKQRVAIARALANEPTLLLADEPTGNLDVETSGRVFDALLAVVRDQGLAAVIATHDRSLARRMDRVVTISDRRIVPAGEAVAV
jgi:lipoprotein-releasing system ATP-binding protein